MLKHKHFAKCEQTRQIQLCKIQMCQQIQISKLTNTNIMRCLGMQANPLLPIPILQRIPKSEEFPYVIVDIMVYLFNLYCRHWQLYFTK